MASLFCSPSNFSTTFSSSFPGNNGDRQHQPNKNFSFLKVINTIKVITSAPPAAMVATSSFPSSPDEDVPGEKMTQKADHFRDGLLTHAGKIYRQTVVIRCNEVSPEKTMTPEAILSFFQDAMMSHLWAAGIAAGGFGATNAMLKNKLSWILKRIHLQIDHYPIWRDVVAIDTWLAPIGKNAVRRDLIFRSQLSGFVFARVTSALVLMNQETRRLSEMPKEVRDEISPLFFERQAIEDDVNEKILKFNPNMEHVESNFQPMHSDIDMNHHINYVSYVRWIIESMPDNFFANHKLSSITVEYIKECNSSNMIQVISVHNKDDSIEEDLSSVRYSHFIRTKGEENNEDCTRPTSTWRKIFFLDNYSK